MRNSTFTSTDKALIERIGLFKNLPNGWDNGFGEGLSEKTYNFAMQFLYANYFNNYLTHNLLSVFATLRTNGSLNLSFSRGDRFVDLLFNNDYSIDLTIEKGIGVKYEIEVECEDIKIDQAIQEILNLCNLSEVYQMPLMTELRVDSKKTGSTRITGVSQYSTLNVQRERAATSVHT